MGALRAFRQALRDAVVHLLGKQVHKHLLLSLIHIFIKTISFPPKPVGLRVFSKKDISKPPQTCSSTMILFEIFRTAGSLSRSL